MIKLSKIILLVLLTPFIAVSQTVIKGVVYEKTDKTPVAGAVISLIDENQELIAYDISSGKGEYTLSIDKTNQKIVLVGRMLGYKEEQLFKFKSSSSKYTKKAPTKKIAVKKAPEKKAPTKKVATKKAPVKRKATKKTKK